MIYYEKVLCVVLLTIMWKKKIFILNYLVVFIFVSLEIGLIKVENSVKVAEFDGWFDDLAVK